MVFCAVNYELLTHHPCYTHTMRLIKRGLLFFLFAFLFFSVTKTFFDYRRNYDFYENYKNEFLQEKKRNTELKTQILKNSDYNEIEKTIRNKLNLLKPNEVAVIIPSPTPTPTIFIPTPPPVYKQWWSVLSGN